MANIGAIRSVGTSLATFLTRAYATTTFPAGITRPTCTFALTSIGGLTTQVIPPTDVGVRVLILLYRASINEHLRNVGRVGERGVKPVPVSVDLRYLLTFWSNSAENEQLVLAWTMRQLHEVPVLDASILSREANWGADEVIQLIPEEISNEDLMRIWDAIDPAYRLSLSYIARVVRIDPEQPTEGRPVVATRFEFAGPTE